MIDWYFVGVNSLWILGCAVILAAVGYHHWLAEQTGRRLREVFRLRSWHLPFWVGMLLVSLGFGLAREAGWWERVLWASLGVSFVWRLVQTLRR